MPHGVGFEALPAAAQPVFLSYVLSFIYVGIYWNNHHHMMHLVETVSGPILWANLHLLFWLSLVPFVTAWMGENQLTTLPVGALWVRAADGGRGLLDPRDPAGPAPGEGPPNWAGRSDATSRAAYRW